jgi:hypothetical protein
MVLTKVYKDIEKLSGISGEMFAFRFVQILLENGLIEPWQVIFNPNPLFRILG